MSKVSNAVKELMEELTPAQKAIAKKRNIKSINSGTQQVAEMAIMDAFSRYVANGLIAMTDTPEQLEGLTTAEVHEHGHKNLRYFSRFFFASVCNIGDRANTSVKYAEKRLEDQHVKDPDSELPFTQALEVSLEQTYKGRDFMKELEAGFAGAHFELFGYDFDYDRHKEELDAMNNGKTSRKALSKEAHAARLAAIRG